MNWRCANRPLPTPILWPFHHLFFVLKLDPPLRLSLSLFFSLSPRFLFFWPSLLSRVAIFSLFNLFHVRYYIYSFFYYNPSGKCPWLRPNFPLSVRRFTVAPFIIVFNGYLSFLFSPIPFTRGLASLNFTLSRRKVVAQTEPVFSFSFWFRLSRDKLSFGGDGFD